MTNDAPQADPDLGGLTVLVVDDTPESLDLIDAILSEEGLEVRTALGGVAAMASVRERRPDLILLDLMMPGMSGIEVCEALKREPELARIPVVFLTAMRESEQELEAFRVGAVDYVTKPVKPEILIARVKTQLRLELLRRESERSARLAGLLAAVVSLGHEINNPLQGITGALDVLRARSSGIDDDVLAELEVVAEQARRIRDVVRRMAHLAEPEFEEYAPGVSMVDLDSSQLDEREE